MDIIETPAGEPVLAVELHNQFKYVARSDLPREVQAKLHSSVQGLLVTRKLAAEYAQLKKQEPAEQSKKKSH